ncbi:hypothetical protein [Winogradskyella immobilis]|uniref:PH domain-containing protein n=1 Tax=Winogradskyella immobilis TaxID=2816852 RepID=A0ABS8ER10_9FLAO|nr:hypothetical protein [Winogradskyella immobilis]MCC1485321.1 hypothetical protein [Winogradskyella immobilis]MCG0017413.1 hypothetical protein [Winogradskyella immobilis]
MRTDNGKVRGFIISVYFVIIIFAIIWVTVFNAFKEVANNPLAVFGIVTALLLALFIGVHAIARYFEYDSDGVKVVIVNRGLLLADRFNYRERKIEFYKKNLVGYKFNNYVFSKILRIVIRRSDGNVSKHRFNVTLVTKRKRKYVRQSLSKILKENKKNT